MDPTTGEVTEVEKLNAKVLELERELKRVATVRKTQSETLGKFALALSKAQGAMMLAAKDTTNPFFNSKYADLASVVEATQKPLSDNELAIVATVLECSSTKVSVESKLIHSSDEWMATVVTVPITTISKDREKVVVVTAQHIGSALTYCRRYGRQCLTGNAPKDDDDGNAASGKQVERQVDAVQRYVEEGPPPAATPPKATTPAAAPGPDFAPDGTPVSERAKLEMEIAQAAEVADLKPMVDRISKLPEEQKAEIRKLWGAKSKELKAASAKPPAPAFAGEKASDRDATAAMDAALYGKKEAKTPPAEVTHFPEPGSEG